MSFFPIGGGATGGSPHRGKAENRKDQCHYSEVRIYLREGGCVKLTLATRGSQVSGFPQPFMDTFALLSSSWGLAPLRHPRL